MQSQPISNFDQNIYKFQQFKTDFIIYINLKQNLIKQFMQALSQQKIAEFKEAFQLFDKDNDNLVDITQLPLLIRSLYQTPTQQQLTQWTGIVDAQKQGRFEFADFLALMASKYKQPQTEDELIQAMNSIFKPKSTSITIKEFRNMMTNLGQKMSDDQLNDLFRELKMQNLESFNFQQFIRTILTK